jgi:hypothetical protein
MKKQIKWVTIAALIAGPEIPVALQSSTVAELFSQQSDVRFSVVKDSGYINVDGGKLFYEIAGQGENIVLLHDGMVNREIWDEQFPVLAILPI